METELRQGLEKMQIEASDEQQTKLIAFINLLEKWNKAYNLTAVRKKQDMLPLHILDSLSLVPYLQDSQHILDVGSGAGLPGIPLAVLEPQRQFVLLDSNGKKTRFIRQAIIELKLENVSVEHTRLENYTPTEKFDCITTRAFATIAETIDMLEHFLTSDAKILFMKSNTAEEETQNLAEDYKKEIFTLSVPGITAPRTVAVVSKH